LKALYSKGLYTYKGSRTGASPPALTYDCEGPRDLCGPEGVGHLADVGPAVLHAQVADGQARDALGPAAVGGERAPVLDPPDGRVGVARGDAGQLHQPARLHLPGLEAV